MTDVDPLLSPDGRFRWDGRRWVATPQQTLRTVLIVLGILAAGMVLLLGLLAVVLGPAIVEMIKVFW
jgi:hypothetical protein